MSSVRLSRAFRKPVGPVSKEHQTSPRASAVPATNHRWVARKSAATSGTSSQMAPSEKAAWSVREALR